MRMCKRLLPGLCETGANGGPGVPKPQQVEDEVPKSRALRFGRLMPMGLSYFASGGSLVMASAAQLITFAILARSLGVEQFGLFAAISAVTTVAVNICGLGATESMVRRVARDHRMYPVMLGHNLILTAI